MSLKHQTLEFPVFIMFRYGNTISRDPGGTSGLLLRVASHIFDQLGGNYFTEAIDPEPNTASSDCVRAVII